MISTINSHCVFQKFLDNVKFCNTVGNDLNVKFYDTKEIFFKKVCTFQIHEILKLL